MNNNLYLLAAMLFVALLAMPAVSAADDTTTTDGEATQADDNINTVEAVPELYSIPLVFARPIS